MPIRIELSDGTVVTPKGMNMSQEANQYVNNPATGIDGGSAQERTIAVVAKELQFAMDYSSRVPKLREELDGLLGRKRRGPRKEVAK